MNIKANTNFEGTDDIEISETRKLIIVIGSANILRVHPKTTNWLNVCNRLKTMFAKYMCL